MVSLSGLAGASGLLMLFGLLIAVIGVIVLGAMRGKGWHFNMVVIAMGLIILGAGWVVGFTAPTASIAPPPPVNANCVVQLASAPALATGETWNAITNTLTVDIVYNKTSNAFVVAASVGSGTAGKPNWVLLPLKLVRTDSINQTFSFPVTIASIPTAASLGASPQTYSFVGYTSATSTSPGIWQTFWSAGVLANQKPIVSAPSVTTNLQTDGTPVNAFASVTSVLHISLGGSNSTSAPTLFAESLQNFTAYPMTIGIGNAAPSLVTITYVPIGWIA